MIVRVDGESSGDVCTGSSCVSLNFIHACQKHARITGSSRGLPAVGSQHDNIPVTVDIGTKSHRRIMRTPNNNVLVVEEANRAENHEQHQQPVSRFPSHVRTPKLRQRRNYIHTPSLCINILYRHYITKLKMMKQVLIVAALAASASAFAPVSRCVQIKICIGCFPCCESRFRN